MPNNASFEHSPGQISGVKLMAGLGELVEVLDEESFAAVRDLLLRRQFEELAAFVTRDGPHFVRNASFGERKACKALLREIISQTFPEFDQGCTLTEPFGPEAQKKFKETGVVAFPELITEQQRQDLFDYLMLNPVYNAHIAGCSDGQPRWIGDNSDPAELYQFGAYAEETIAQAPHVLDIAFNPALHNFVKSYFGLTPTLRDLHLWWSFPNPEKFGPQPFAGQQFHRDYRSLQDVQFFICLSDSEDDDGRHEYFTGTHDPVIFSRQLDRFSGLNDMPADEVLQAVFFPPGDGYGRDEHWSQTLSPCLETIPIRARHGFMIDTMGLHRGVPPTRRRRMVMSVRLTGAGAGGAIYKRTHGGEPISELDYVQSDYLTRLQLAS